MAAITTWPWSSSVSVPSSIVSGTVCEARSATWTRVPSCGSRRVVVAGAVAVVRGRVGGREGLLDLLVDVGAAGGVRDGLRVGEDVLQRAAEGGLGLGQRHAVLRALRAGERRDDRAQVQLQRLAVGRLLGVLVVPQALRAGVGLDDLALLLGAAREAHVADRLVVDREDRAGGAELRAHVADRRAVGERRVGHARAVELDELADDLVLAQHLRDREHEVGRGRALGQLAVELEADDARDQHRDRLAEHRGLGLDAADAPAQHAQAVDHRRVRVGAHERVRVQDPVLLEHGAREVLEVDLVDDAGLRRDDHEALEGRLAPAQELVALLVALVLALGVEAQRLTRAEGVDLDRVVDDQLGRDQRVDLLRDRRPGRTSRRAAPRGPRSPARR